MTRRFHRFQDELSVFPILATAILAQSGLHFGNR